MSILPCLLFCTQWLHHTWYILRFRTFQVVPLFISRTAPNFRVLFDCCSTPGDRIHDVYIVEVRIGNFSVEPNRTFEFGTARHLLIFLFVPQANCPHHDEMDHPKITIWFDFSGYFSGLSTWICKLVHHPFKKQNLLRLMPRCLPIPSDWFNPEAFHAPNLWVPE